MGCEVFTCDIPGMSLSNLSLEIGQQRSPEAWQGHVHSASASASRVAAREQGGRLVAHASGQDRGYGAGQGQGEGPYVHIHTHIERDTTAPKAQRSLYVSHVAVV
jgi:hypothetical protein